MADLGEGSGGGPPPHFLTKLRPEGPKKIFFLDRVFPLSQGLDDRPPSPPPHPSPYLNVWIRHWIEHGFGAHSRKKKG